MEQRYALIAPDLVVGPQTDPLRNLPVLACLLRQDLLDLEGLVRGLQNKDTHASSTPEPKRKTVQPAASCGSILIYARRPQGIACGFLTAVRAAYIPSCSRDGFFFQVKK